MGGDVGERAFAQFCGACDSHPRYYRCRLAPCHSVVALTEWNNLVACFHGIVGLLLYHSHYVGVEEISKKLGDHGVYHNYAGIYSCHLRMRGP